jgi:hypothetical protein
MTVRMYVRSSVGVTMMYKKYEKVVELPDTREGLQELFEALMKGSGVGFDLKNWKSKSKEVKIDVDKRD